MVMQEWVRLPSHWISMGGLHFLHWGEEGGRADSTAALMILMAVAHHADQEQGIAKLTYDDLSRITGLSRPKVSSGLSVLIDRLGIVAGQGRSTYRLDCFDPRGSTPETRWAKFPAKRLYRSGRIAVFDNFHLRLQTELNALKLFFLFAAQRGEDTNAANISLDRIEGATGIDRYRIKAATSLLAANSLVYVEHVPSALSEWGIANAYRLVGLDPHVHMGTRGRQSLF